MSSAWWRFSETSVGWRQLNRMEREFWLLPLSTATLMRIRCTLFISKVHIGESPGIVYSTWLLNFRLLLRCQANHERCVNGFLSFYFGTSLVMSQLSPDFVWKQTNSAVNKVQRCNWKVNSVWKYIGSEKNPRKYAQINFFCLSVEIFSEFCALDESEFITSLCEWTSVVAMWERNPLRGQIWI